MKLLIFASRRLGRLLLTIFLISTIVFFVIRVIPGDPALVVAGMDATQEAIDAIRIKLGTDQPLPVQYLQWLWKVARFDFGESLISDQSVIKLVFQRFPLTLSLAVLGILISIVIGIPLGVLSAVKRWSLWDYSGMAFSQIGMAIPSFWLGIMLLLIFAVKIPIFPLFGSGSIVHLILPSISLGIARAAIILRLTRASMIEELSKEYVITARAKGLTERMVKYKHALKNALLPVITITGIQLGYMLGGAIITEQVFSLPGLGRLFLTGIYQRDFPLIQGGVVFVAIIFSLINFTVDILYSVINPRIQID
ncbi:MAG: ABC transporter permease [Spirochaetales bacterium]|nr:ABC transporter permease [Spirochaetales bacterium]